MDPNLLVITLGLITNGLTSLVAQLGRKGGKLIIGENFIDDWELKKTSLQPILQEAIDEIVNKSQLKGWETCEEIVCLFLQSPEAEEIVRQIYSTVLIEREQTTSYAFENAKVKAKRKKEKQKSFDQVRKLFSSSLFLFIDSYPNTIIDRESQFNERANSLFRAGL